jgi:hypothetical protein
MNGGGGDGAGEGVPVVVPAAGDGAGVVCVCAAPCALPGVVPKSTGGTGRGGTLKITPGGRSALGNGLPHTMHSSAELRFFALQYRQYMESGQNRRLFGLLFSDAGAPV